MSTLRLACFTAAGLLGAITIVWAQAEAGGFVEACKYWSSTITIVGGAVLLVGGVALAWGDVRHRLDDAEDAITKINKRDEVRESALSDRFRQQDARIEKLELKRDEQHRELLEHLKRIEGFTGGR